MSFCMLIMIACIISDVAIEFAKLLAFRAYVHYVPMHLTCLRAFVPQITTCLRAYVPTCLKLVRAYVPLFFTCLRAFIFHLPTCLRAYIYFSGLRAFVP